jgi:hypothetical protein
VNTTACFLVDPRGSLDICEEHDVDMVEIEVVRGFRCEWTEITQQQEKQYSWEALPERQTIENGQRGLRYK